MAKATKSDAQTRRTTRPVEHILNELCETGKQNETVTIGQVVTAIGDRGWGPFLFVPALIEISPLGGVPGVPTVLAAIIAVFAVQIALGRDSTWLPGVIERRGVTGKKLNEAMDKMHPVGERLDRWFHGRLPSFTSDKATRAAALVTLVLCLTVPPLELLPFASTGPMLAIAVFGLALTLGDGALMIAGFVLSAIAVALGVGFWSL